MSETPEDRIKLPEDGWTTNPPPEEAVRRATILAALQRAPGEVSSLRLMDMTKLKAEELFPVIIELEREGKVATREVGPQRLMYSLPRG